MNFHIITLFPESFTSYLGESILARAKKEKKINFFFYNPREYVSPTKTQAKNKKPYLRVDDKPYGGGPGMVMQAEPVAKAIEKALKKTKKGKTKIIFLSPAGKQFTTSYAKSAAKKFTDIIIIAGRYEGIDERINKIFKTEKVSVGPFVLTGGELGAMLIIDSISRQIPGVLGNFSSLEEERVSSPEVYTRPEVLKWKGKKYAVPKILLSGHHKNIDAWRQNR
jgi:tRNA (guanine37-N1)-methyltransferase